MGSELLSFLWKMKHFIFLFSLLVATSLSSPVAEDDMILGWLFKPDCSKPVFAPFGLYNPCPDTSTTTTAPTTTTTTATTTTTTTTTTATCSASSSCSDGSSGCQSGTVCYDGNNVLNGNCCGQAANFCLISSATAGAGVAVTCP